MLNLWMVGNDLFFRFIKFSIPFSCSCWWTYDWDNNYDDDVTIKRQVCSEWNINRIIFRELSSNKSIEKKDENKWHCGVTSHHLERDSKTNRNQSICVVMKTLGLIRMTVRPCFYWDLSHHNQTQVTMEMSQVDLWVLRMRSRNIYHVWCFLINWMTG